ncbi:ACP S-malonyltransferase [candidate division KSB1 bacterium]
MAFIYPGQGSQTVGMGRDLFDAFPEARTRYDEAEKLLGFPLQEYSFEGPEEALKETYVTQPALFVHSVVLTELLKKRNIIPSIAAGHSLGEYSALAAAEGADFRSMLELVKVRGRLMQHAGEKSPGTMAALIGADFDTVQSMCKEAERAGVVVPANFNAPGQIVISGSVEGVHEVMECARDHGVKRAVELNVGGAFHSPLMKDAIEGLIKKIGATEWNPLTVPVVSNVTAAAEIDPDAVKVNLKKQLLNPVLWSNSVEFMADSGIAAFIEVGAGTVLKGLVKRIRKTIPCYSVSTVEDLESIEDSLLR